MYSDLQGQGLLQGPVDRCMAGTTAESMQFNQGVCQREMDNFETLH